MGVVRSPEHLAEIRLGPHSTAFSPAPHPGIAEGRYRPDESPQFAFEGGAFDLALCSHFLFLYSDQLSTALHLAAIEEMCRVVEEARVFPLLVAYGAPSPQVEPVIRVLRDLGYAAEVRRVPYEFLRGGAEMLSVTAP